MKRLLSMLLVLACLLPLAAWAEEEAADPAFPQHLHPGDTLNVTLALTCTGLAGLQGEVRYDPLVFDAVGDCTFDETFRTGAMIAMISPLAEAARASWSCAWRGWTATRPLPSPWPCACAPMPPRGRRAFG